MRYKIHKKIYYSIFSLLKKKLTIGKKLHLLNACLCRMIGRNVLYERNAFTFKNSSYFIVEKNKSSYDKFVDYFVKFIEK